MYSSDLSYYQNSDNASWTQLENKHVPVYANPSQRIDKSVDSNLTAYVPITVVSLVIVCRQAICNLHSCSLVLRCLFRMFSHPREAGGTADYILSLPLAYCFLLTNSHPAAWLRRERDSDDIYTNMTVTVRRHHLISAIELVFMCRPTIEI